MSFKRFLYYLLKPDGRSGQVINDTVTYTGSPKQLPQTPEGWQEIQIAYERPKESHGLKSSFSLPFKFPRDGARIIRDAAYKTTIEERLYLLIQRLNLDITDTTFKYIYRYFYKGELDLSKMEDSQDFVEVPVLSSRTDILFNANAEKVFEFPMFGEKVVYLKHDGVALEGKANYVALDGVEIGYPEFIANGYAFIPFSFISMEKRANGFAFVSQNFEQPSGSFDDWKANSSNFFAQASALNSTTVDLHITGTLLFTCTERTASSVSLFLRFITSTQTDQLLYNFLVGTLIEGEEQSVDIDLTIPMLPGEKIYLVHFLDLIGTSVSYEFLPESNITIDFVFREKATVIPCYRRYDLFSESVKKTLGNDAFAESQLCKDFNSLLITCGNAIRGVENSHLQTSLKDVIKDNDATLMAGWEIPINENGLRLEARETFYPDDETDEIYLGNVTDLKIVPATDLMATSYKFGHKKQDIEDINGKYDPNGNNEFSGPLQRVETTYEMISPFKAGPYEIELMRINYEGKETTDDNSDNDVFVIAGKQQSLSETLLLSFVTSGGYIVLPNDIIVAAGTKFRVTGSVSNDGVFDVTNVLYGDTTQTVYVDQSIVLEFTVSVLFEIISGEVYLLDRETYDDIEGVPNDSVYNLKYLTPKTMLLRHKRWLASINDGHGSKKITFSSGKDNKNTGLKTELSGVVIDEDSDERISTFGELLFKPWYFICKSPGPLDPALSEILEENPNRVFRITDENGNDWRGFLRLSGIAPNDYSPQEWRLLATKNNDMKKRIQ